MKNLKEEYIINNADTFDWDSFEFDMNYYSKEFIEDFKENIRIRVWLNSEGKRHREDGPAIEFASGSKAWYQNNKLHRTDGPAYIGADGTKSWFINGFRHREDGPAVMHSDGTNFWYLEGIEYSKQKFKNIILWNISI